MKVLFVEPEECSASLFASADDSPSARCYDELQLQLMMILLTNLVIGNLQERMQTRIQAVNEWLGDQLEEFKFRRKMAAARRHGVDTEHALKQHVAQRPRRAAKRDRQRSQSGGLRASRATGSPSAGSPVGRAARPSTASSAGRHGSPAGVPRAGGAADKPTATAAADEPGLPFGRPPSPHAQIEAEARHHLPRDDACAIEARAAWRLLLARDPTVANLHAAADADAGARESEPGESFKGGRARAANRKLWRRMVSGRPQTPGSAAVTPARPRAGAADEEAAGAEWAASPEPSRRGGRVGTAVGRACAAILAAPPGTDPANKWAPHRELMAAVDAQDDLPPLLSEQHGLGPTFYEYNEMAMQFGFITMCARRAAERRAVGEPPARRVHAL